jgi:hypothetical protein
MADAFRPTRRAAIRLQAGSAAARNRRRSSGTHCAASARRSPRRTCTRSCRYALPWSSAADPCRNIRSSVAAAAPWWSPHSLSPLPLWERSDRIDRCDPGEGLWPIDRPEPLTPTLSHKGRGSSPSLPQMIANRMPEPNDEYPSISATRLSAGISAVASGFPSGDRVRSRNAHAPRSGAASAHC